MKVRLKREIVTMGVPGIDPARDAGAYVDPEDWNARIGAPDVVVIDTRNDYEVDIGTFRGAINPQTASVSSEERRVGKEGARTCGAWRSPDIEKKQFIRGKKTSSTSNGTV